MGKPPKPPATWLLVQPTGDVLGDELGWVAMRRFIKCLGRQYRIKLLDIRSQAGVTVNAPEKPLANSGDDKHQRG